MTERPIIFSAPMVQAILESRKNMTRRVLKPRGIPVQAQSDEFMEGLGREFAMGAPKPAAGDLLWVKETYHLPSSHDDCRPSEAQDEWVWYPATDRLIDHDPMTHPGKRRSPRFMPRWASRITLRVTEVKVERLWEMSEADACREGFDEGYVTVDGVAEGWTAKTEFRGFWNSLHGPGAWDANPWVAAISFERVT